MINNCVFEGRLVNKNNYRVFHNSRTGRDNPSLLFTIAVPRNYKNRNGQRISDFFNCRLSGGQAQYINQFVGIGDTIVVSGELHNDNYQSNRYRDSQGNPALIRNLQVTVFNADLAGRSRRNQARGMSNPADQGMNQGQPQQPQQPQSYPQPNQPAMNPQNQGNQLPPSNPNQPMPRQNNNPNPKTQSNSAHSSSVKSKKSSTFNPFANKNNQRDPFSKHKSIDISDKDLPF